MESKLLENLKAQLTRLVQEMKDLEESKSEMADVEYEEMKEDIKEQLKEFEASLAKISCGDLSTVDSLTAVRLAVRAAVSEAFQTPEVIKLFAEKQNGGLRQRICEIERDFKVGAMSKDEHVARKVELLGALKRLGENLSPEDETFLTANLSDSMKHFVQVSSDIELQDTQAILSLAKRA